MYEKRPQARVCGLVEMCLVVAVLSGTSHIHQTTLSSSPRSDTLTTLPLHPWVTNTPLILSTLKLMCTTNGFVCCALFPTTFCRVQQLTPLLNTKCRLFYSVLLLHVSRTTGWRFQLWGYTDSPALGSQPWSQVSMLCSPLIIVWTVSLYSCSGVLSVEARRLG